MPRIILLEQYRAGRVNNKNVNYQVPTDRIMDLCKECFNRLRNGMSRMPIPNTDYDIEESYCDCCGEILCEEVDGYNNFE